jgi:hypothetical protein
MMMMQWFKVVKRMKVVWTLKKGNRKKNRKIMVLILIRATVELEYRAPTW